MRKEGDIRIDNLTSLLEERLNKVEQNINPESVYLVLSILGLECVEKLQCKTCSREEQIRCLKMYAGRAKLLWHNLLTDTDHRWAKKLYYSKLFDLIDSMLKDANITTRLWHKELQRWVPFIDIQGNKVLIVVGDKIVESPMSLYDPSVKTDADVERLKSEEKEREFEKAKMMAKLQTEIKKVRFTLKREYILRVKQKVTLDISKYDLLLLRRKTHKLFVWRKDNSVWIIPTEKVWGLKVAKARREALDYLKANARCIYTPSS